MAERSRDWVGPAIALAVLVAVVLLLAPPPTQVATDRRVSSFRTTPDGAGALYEALARLGVAVDRRMTPLAGADSIRGPLVVLEPVEPLSPAELDSLMAWVERGGRLVVAPPYGPRYRERLGLALEWLEAAASMEAVDHPWTQGMDSLGTAVNAFDPDTLRGAELEPLVVAGPHRRPVVGRLRHGRGEILAISNGGLLSNGEILESGLAPVVVRAVADWAGAGGTVWFDEYHHGHRGGSPYRAVGGFLLGGGTGGALLQLVAVALLALLPAVIRFGSPVSAAPPSRRSRLEHVSALGAVYREARAEALARRRLLAGFARRIGRERPPPGGEARFLDRLLASLPAGHEQLTPVVEAWHSDAPLPELSRRIDEAIRTLNRAP